MPKLEWKCLARRSTSVSPCRDFSHEGPAQLYLTISPFSIFRFRGLGQGFPTIVGNGKDRHQIKDLRVSSPQVILEVQGSQNASSEFDQMESKWIFKFFLPTTWRESQIFVTYIQQSK